MADGGEMAEEAGSLLTPRGADDCTTPESHERSSEVHDDDDTRARQLHRWSSCRFQCLRLAAGRTERSMLLAMAMLCVCALLRLRAGPQIDAEEQVTTGERPFATELLELQEEDAESRFVHGEKGTDACPEDSVAITSAKLCKAYAATLPFSERVGGPCLARAYQTACQAKDHRRHAWWCKHRPLHCWKDRNGCVVYKGGGANQNYAFSTPICFKVYVDDFKVGFDSHKQDANWSLLRKGITLKKAKIPQEHEEPTPSSTSLNTTATETHTSTSRTTLPPTTTLSTTYDAPAISTTHSTSAGSTSQNGSLEKMPLKEADFVRRASRVNPTGVLEQLGKEAQEMAREAAERVGDLVVQSRRDSSNTSNFSDRPNATNDTRLAENHSTAQNLSNVTRLPAKAHSLAPSHVNSTSSMRQSPSFKLPASMAGVNFGGWLCLEDWFFSGSTGRFVDSQWPFVGQGACLPPEEVATRDEPWQSEGTLTRQLGADAIRVIEAHRNSFITEVDFEQAASIGIKVVRVPLTWAAFAEALAPAAPDVYGMHNPDNETAIVPDPFYKDEIAMATIPHDFMLRILGWATKHKVKVLWDIHAHVGGSSNGTYSGVWPKNPAFWNSNFAIGNASISLFEAGLWIAAALVKWVDGLSGADLKATHGVTLMNEPAHLSVGQSWAKEWQVLDWLSKAGDMFRQSGLPKKGVLLYVNIVETAFHNWFSGFIEVVPPWWHKTFSWDERHSWAVIDGHKYYSWDAQCAGCTGGVPAVCGWDCNNDPDGWVRGKVRGCIDSWVTKFATIFPGENKAVSEFSLGTYREGPLACSSEGITRMFLEEQLDAFKKNGLEPFFWTWRLPYGHPFEAGWSLKYIVGLEEKRPPYGCPRPRNHNTLSY